MKINQSKKMLFTLNSNNRKTRSATIYGSETYLVLKEKFLTILKILQMSTMSRIKLFEKEKA